MKKIILMTIIFSGMHNVYSVRTSPKRQKVKGGRRSRRGVKSLRVNAPVVGAPVFVSPAIVPTLPAITPTTVSAKPTIVPTVPLAALNITPTVALAEPTVTPTVTPASLAITPTTVSGEPAITPTVVLAEPTVPSTIPPHRQKFLEVQRRINFDSDFKVPYKNHRAYFVTRTREKFNEIRDEKSKRGEVSPEDFQALNFELDYINRFLQRLDNFNKHLYPDDQETKDTYREMVEFYLSLRLWLLGVIDTISMNIKEKERQDFKAAKLMDNE